MRQEERSDIVALDERAAGALFPVGVCMCVCMALFGGAGTEQSRAGVGMYDLSHTATCSPAKCHICSSPALPHKRARTHPTS